ncbi:tungsten formylmethanofuran dehydrogenase [Sphingobacteriales bacterium UPWRP_1]|nr:tungsten formylmethanofuran dehydrogenase [Sphingobacteriales bacterium TSM_CSM]PSJ78445.1 tungsten formylmethanofuran dehydrogenase [Sphingobacteriales bacterium UPWRP_1]
MPKPQPQTAPALPLPQHLLLKTYRLMQTARHMAETYDANRQICKYVHSTSRGHEAIQLAAGFQLEEYDYAAPYYRDESMLLGMGYAPYQLMLQLLAKADDYFSGGRSYYSHPSAKLAGFPKIPHQSSATGMQAIPATGMAQGIKYKETMGFLHNHVRPIVLCSLGDGSVTEGEVSEAFQFAALHQLPVLYLVQDNDWGISVSADEARSMDAYEYVAGFKGLKRMRTNGTNFVECYLAMQEAIAYVRNKRKPLLLHVKVPLLGHHTSGVRKEWYRSPEDLAEHALRDPLPHLERYLLQNGVATAEELTAIADETAHEVADAFAHAVAAPEPKPETLLLHEFAPTPVTEERGQRSPANGRKVVMVDAALYAMDEILATHPEAVFYGQDVGRRLGGVFREAATLAEKYGDARVFNTAIQEAYLVGSTAGMSAVGLKPIVEIQFADYIWSGVNQLVVELSKSCYLSMGKYPVQSLIRVPIGAYGGGGPYHSGCIESSILAVRGIKVIYPSNAADMKGLLKAAFLDPNPVVCFEHKGLYWSKVPGTEDAKNPEPDEEYIIPLGKANIALLADEKQVKVGNSVGIITYGMGVYWAKNAAPRFNGSVEVLDLRTLNPLDETAVYEQVKRHNKVIILTEEPVTNSFAQTIAGRIAQHCFKYLDAPVRVVGAASIPAVPLNTGLEREMLPNEDKLAKEIEELLNW